MEEDFVSIFTSSSANLNASRINVICEKYRLQKRHINTCIFMEIRDLRGRDRSIDSEASLEVSLQFSITYFVPLNHFNSRHCLSPFRARCSLTQRLVEEIFKSLHI